MDRIADDCLGLRKNIGFAGQPVGVEQRRDVIAGGAGERVAVAQDPLSAEQASEP